MDTELSHGNSTFLNTSPISYTLCLLMLEYFSSKIYLEES